MWACTDSDAGCGKKKNLPNPGTVLPWYIYTSRMIDKTYLVQRVQTGVRIEKRLLKVLRALADYRDMSLGDLLEGMVLHAFEGKCPFEAETLSRIRELKKFFGLDLDARASHKLREGAKTNTGKSRSGE